MPHFSQCHAKILFPHSLFCHGHEARPSQERAAISHSESTNKTTPNIKKLLQEKVSTLKQLAAENSQAIENVETAKLQADEEPSKSDNNTGQIENADIGVEVKCAEALQQLCQTKANITQLAVDPAKCTVRGEGRETQR